MIFASIIGSLCWSSQHHSDRDTGTATSHDIFRQVWRLCREVPRKDLCNSDQGLDGTAGTQKSHHNPRKGSLWTENTFFFTFRQSYERTYFLIREEWFLILAVEAPRPGWWEEISSQRFPAESGVSKIFPAESGESKIRKTSCPFPALPWRALSQTALYMPLIATRCLIVVIIICQPF